MWGQWKRDKVDQPLTQIVQKFPKQSYLFNKFDFVYRVATDERPVML